MASIQYTSIINSVVSQEGWGGNYTNYVYYSVLVKYSDGTSSIVEGKLNDIQFLLAFLKTPQDEIEILRSELRDLENIIQNLDNNIINTIDNKINYAVDSFRSKIDYVLDTLYPLPDVIGMNANKGIAVLKSYGLRVIVLNKNLKANSDDQLIKAVRRKKKDYKTVEVLFSYTVPEIIGLPVSDASSILTDAGFTPNVKYIPTYDNSKDGIVIKCIHENDYSFEVDLEVYKLILNNRDLDDSDTSEIIKSLQGISGEKEELNNMIDF